MEIIDSVHTRCIVKDKWDLLRGVFVKNQGFFIEIEWFFLWNS